MTSKIVHHPVLGAISGTIVNGKILQLFDLPYGSVPERFSRSTLLNQLPPAAHEKAYDATHIPPASVQPTNAPSMDCKSNQFPTDLVEGHDEKQSEDCLRLNITMPVDASPSSALPVLVFLHGGAFFLGSSTRPYYNPIHFYEQALSASNPHIFISMNYRLGALGFFHSKQAEDLMPANRGLHDQLVGFQWVEKYIGGFGGDPNNINAMGQSAGGMSLSLHNLSGKKNVWKRSVQFSGSLVTMPVQTPEEHECNFISQAQKLGISTEDTSSKAIAEKMITLPLDKIRDTGYVGLACSQTELLPYERASMALTRRRAPESSNLESQIVSSTTYDGGISYNMMIGDESRRDHAAVFINIAKDVLKHPQELLDLYEIRAGEEDAAALIKICQFESDIGFFAASLAQAQGFPGKTYLMIFDLGNPFDGPLRPKEYATHTWDIVALLGAYEKRLDAQYGAVIREFREKILAYVIEGVEPWPSWTAKRGTAMMVSRTGLKLVESEEYMGGEGRRGRLLAMASKEAGDDGCDVLWSNVCRRFLMQGS